MIRLILFRSMNLSVLQANEFHKLNKRVSFVLSFFKRSKMLLDVKLLMDRAVKIGCQKKTMLDCR